MNPSEGSRDELRSRRLSTEDMIREQLDRINAIRSNPEHPERVEAWSEAQEALVDLLAPWAEAEQEDERRKTKNPAAVGRFYREWSDRPVGIVYDEWRQAVVVPTAKDCRIAQRIIMGLLDRQGLLVKRRNVSGPPQKEETKDQEPESVELPL